MKIAYIVSAYKYPQQLVRLIQRLHTGASLFFIHVDKRAGDWVYRQIVDSLEDFSNVHFLKRHKCYWGSFGHVEATIKGIDALVSGRFAFDYAVLLTGQDYPIKPNSYIEELFQEGGGKIFMEYSALPHASWERGGMDRIQYWHFRPLAKYCRALADRDFDVRASGSRPPLWLSLAPIRRKFPQGFEPYGGSSYWCMPRECIEYLYDFIAHHRSFVNYFKYVDVPDEIFFQTIVLNSQLRSNVANDDLRYVRWKDPDSASPSILRKGDFPEIQGSAKLFARKFDATVDADILDMIDHKLLAVK